jgi:Na+/H+ antiporter NhaA
MLSMEGQGERGPEPNRNSVRPDGGATLGVFAGLMIGKPVGIAAAWLAVRSGRAALPAGVGWRQVAGAALGGIGFTMSLFVATLAFADEGLLAAANTPRRRCDASSMAP